LTHKDKKEQKIRNNIYNVSLPDLERLILQYGTIKNADGDHAVACIGKINYGYPRHNPVKPAYVRAIIKMIDIKGKR
jgi:hypothetical protein